MVGMLAGWPAGWRGVVWLGLVAGCWLLVAGCWLVVTLTCTVTHQQK